jgi:HEAT repeat protein
VALGNFPPPMRQAVDALLTAIHDGDDEVKWAAIISLGKVGKESPEAQEAVWSLVHDPNPTTAMKAALASANLGKDDDELIPGLIKGLESAPPDESTIAVSSIARLLPSHEDTLLPVVMNGIKSTRVPLALNSIKVLKMAHTGDDKAVSELTRIYGAADPQARVLIIEALPELDKKGDLIKTVLSKGFKDPDAKVRLAAIRVAGQYAPDPQVFKNSLLAALNDPDHDNRLAALGIVSGTGVLNEGQDKRILALRKDTDPKVRARAVSVLGNLKTTPEIMSGLKSSLSDTSVEVRTSAVASLRNIGLRKPEAVIPILEGALKSEKDYRTQEFIGATLYQFGKHVPIMPVPPGTLENKIVPGWEVGGQGS